MDSNLQQIVETTQIAPEEIAAKTRHIYEAILLHSPSIDQGNFTRIHPNDLRRLFELYDQVFFDDQCQRALGDIPIHFQLSKRMTKAGGRTALYCPRVGPGQTYYELTVSSTLLYCKFHDGDRGITVNGLPCQDRLEALQRIFEHEVIHLVEMLLWTRSSCAAQRFQSIAARFFGHTDHTHQLITPGERAWSNFGIRPGDRVKFKFDGTDFVGLVNQITKRATILVEDEHGQRFTDGKHYKKFYVPVGMLEKE